MLSAEKRNQLWIPAGFAHGFITLSETAEFQYKTTDFYSTKSERCIAWNDPAIGIEWPMDFTPLLSDKDKKGLALIDLIFSTAAWLHWIAILHLT